MDAAKYTGRYHRAFQPAPGVLLIEFDRPPVNAFHDGMWRELRAIIDRVSSDSTVRVIVLGSALDKYFTAGLDLTSQSTLTAPSLDPARKAVELRAHITEFQDAISSLAKCRQPVIVALSGYCMGLGIDIASACDIRLAASDVIFAIAEVDAGLTADIGSLQRFPKIIGNDSKARELALTARRFGPTEAKEIGFVSGVVKGGRNEVTAAAVELAKVIASKSPIAVLGTKNVMNHARDHTVQEGLDYTAVWNMAMLQSVDMQVAIKGVMTKKVPKFEPLAPIKSKL